MKSIKTIALALAISAGACTMHAAPKQESDAKVVAKWCVPAVLAYYTEKLIRADVFFASVGGALTFANVELKGTKKGLLLGTAIIVARPATYALLYAVYRGAFIHYFMEKQDEEQTDEKH